MANFGEAGAEVFDELDEVFHGLDDLGDGQVVEDLFAVPTQLPDLRLVEGDEHGRGSLQDAPGARDEAVPAVFRVGVGLHLVASLLQVVGCLLDRRQRPGHLALQLRVLQHKGNYGIMLSLTIFAQIS